MTSIMGDKDLSQVTYARNCIRCRDGEEGTVPSSYSADNAVFTGLGGYIGLVLGRETTVIYETTLTFQPSSNNGDGSINGQPLSLPRPSPSPPPPPPPLPSHSTSPSPPPPSPPPSPSHSFPPSTSSPPPASSLPSHSPSFSPPMSSSPSPSPSPSLSPSPPLSPVLSSPPTTPAQRKSSNLGPIVGGIVGGISLLLLLLLFYCHRRRLSKNIINPFPSPLNQGPNDSMVMLVPPHTKRCAAGSSSSHFTSSPSLFSVEPLQHADSGIRNVEPGYVLPITRVELPPAYTQA